MKLYLSQVTKATFLLVASAAPGILLSGTAAIAQIVPINPIPLPTICVERNLSRDGCARLFSELQESQIIRDIKIEQIPKIKIPDRCLSCPIIPKNNPQIQQIKPIVESNNR